MKPEVREDVPLSSIVIVPELQVRERLSEQQLARYTTKYKSEADMLPIKVARIGTAEGLVLIDGYHRYEAMRAAGVVSTTVEVWHCEDMAEAAWVAAEANLGHGLPLKKREYREAFRRYIKAQRHVVQRGRNGSHRKVQSYRDIGRVLGCNHTTIRNWMKEDFGYIAERMGSEERRGSGGHRGDDRTQEEVFAGLCRESLTEAATNASAITDPQVREELAEEAERVAKVIREGGRLEETADF